MVKNTDDQDVHVMSSDIDAFQIIRSIADSGLQEDAFYIFDVGEIIQKHREWKLTLPRVEPHYAVKCNDHQLVLESLAALGTSFDCASKVEINKVLALGVDPSRIVFANPAKPITQINHAKATGVDLMTFDSETELRKVKSVFSTARLVLRIRCDAKIAQCPLGLKFGCNPVTEAPGLIHLAKVMGLNVVGISFHVGSGCGEPTVFRRAIASAKILFDYAATLGFNFNILDIGGGFPGTKGSSLRCIGDIVNRALEDYFPDPNVRIIAEPGRFYAASAFTLATHVYSRREILNDGDKTISHIMYYINDGVYGALNCVLHDHYHPQPVPLSGFGGKLIPSSVWGPTCDSLDQVVENVSLPSLEVGDWIVFESMGAYTSVAATEFNGFPQAKIYAVIDQDNWLILENLLPRQRKNFQFKPVIDREAIEDFDFSAMSPNMECRRQSSYIHSSVTDNMEMIDEALCLPPPTTPFNYEYVPIGSVN